MFQIYECITAEHDLRLVLVAAALCLFGALVAVSIVRRGAFSIGRSRVFWLFGAAFATGVVAWGTHFIAMLAYQPGPAISFAPTLTALSLLAGVTIPGFGWATAAAGRGRAAHLVGGALAGLGVTVMHYAGMAAVVADARMVWDPTFIALSAVTGAVFGALAARVLLAGRRVARVYTAAVLLTLSIAGLHFTGMTALEMVPDPTLARPNAIVSPVLVAWMVAIGATALLALGLAGVIFDQHLSSRRAREMARLREIADAGFEGLAVETRGVIRDCNTRLQQMLGVEAEALEGRSLAEFLDCPEAPAREGAAVSCRLRRADGGSLQVEILSRVIEMNKEEARVYAVRDVSDRVKAEARILHLAHHDALTGLANRARFNEFLSGALKAAARGKTGLAVICFDLDRFKIVNDIHGHAAGDHLLEELARRLGEELPLGAMAARLGGDEFAIILPGENDGRAACAVAGRVISRVSEPYDFHGMTLSVGASAGVAMHPRHGDDPDTLVSRADMALYRAKNDGGDGARMFEAAMDAMVRERREMEADLRVALNEGGLELHYQPQVSADTGLITGIEALVRWRRGDALVPPADFIPLAEETGLILPLGEWVMHEACREAAAWPLPYPIAVNVSPAQFKQGNLVFTVQTALERSGLDPARLELEITEGVLIEDEARARDMLQWLKALGVRIAMDDFGTGYSSLNYLRSFPFDKIKLDRSFITGLQDQRESRAIVRATASLARDLGLGVVAEGVETAADLAALREERCVDIQGYLISRPVTAGQLAPFFGAEPPHMANFIASGVKAKVELAS
jgi:diguanylate cyclase